MAHHGRQKSKSVYEWGIRKRLGVAGEDGEGEGAGAGAGEIWRKEAG